MHAEKARQRLFLCWLVAYIPSPRQLESLEFNAVAKDVNHKTLPELSTKYVELYLLGPIKLS